MSELGLVVRGLDPSDLDDALEIWRQPGVVAGTMRLPCEEPERMRRKMAETSDGLHRLVAEVRDGDRRRVVGILALFVGVRRRNHSAALAMAVHDAWQRRGIGRALLENAIELADGWLGLTRIELDVFVDNTAAVELYERCGFEVEGTRRQFARRAGELVDVYCMARLR